MTVRLPNRVGERGIFNDMDMLGASVTLTGEASPGMRTCADAEAAGQLSDGDLVGASIVSTADSERWLVATMTYYSTAELVLDSFETGSTTPITNGESVDVTLCVTSQTLDWYVNGLPVPPE